MNTDLVLASFYQSNGAVSDGSTWCSGAFYNEVKTSVTAAAEVMGQAGFGPRGKCTW